MTDMVEVGGTKYEVKGRVVSDVALEPGAALYAWTKAHSGAVVVLRVPDDVARAIALDAGDLGGPYQGGDGEFGALAPGDLHLTLAYLGDAAAIDEATRERVRRALRWFTGAKAPIEGTFNGRVAFDLPGGGATAFCAHFDAPSLPDFRAELVEALEAAGATVANHHGFTPHVTLAYLPRDTELPLIEVPEGAVRLGSLELWDGPGRALFSLVGDKARHARDRCMRCKAPPDVEVLWADGRGRAWFCKACFEAWKREEGEKVSGVENLEIVKVRDVEGDHVTPHWNRRKKEFDPAEIAEGAKPWTSADPPPPATNWTDDEKEKCVAAANAVLERGGTEQEAVFACIHAAGKTEHPGRKAGAKHPRGKAGAENPGGKEGDMKEIKVLVDDEAEGEKAWDGSPTRYASTEAYCRACLINLNRAAGKTDPADWTQNLCKLPTKAPGSDEHNFAGVMAAAQALAGARAPLAKPAGISQEDWSKAKAGAARTVAAQYRANDREPPESVAKLAEKARGTGQGAGGPRQGDGGVDECVCPECGVTTPHEKGVPCSNVACPECGAPMAPAGEKAGRRVRSDKVGLLERLRSEFSDLQAVIQEVLSWARYEDGDEPAEKAAGLADALAARMAELGAKSIDDLPAGFAFMGRDGRPWWFQWTTNAFRDREREIFTTKAIYDLVERHDKEIEEGKRSTRGEFWFWHIPGTFFADVAWEAPVGRFLAQAGPFKETAIGRKFLEFFMAHPMGHDEIAPRGWGTSHGYFFKARDRDDGVYEEFEIKESTVLPSHVASNPWNPLASIVKEAEMNEQQLKALRAIGGDEFAQMVQEAGERTTKELEQIVDYKSAGGEGEKASCADRVKAAMDKIGDAKLKDKVAAFLGKMIEETGEKSDGGDAEGEKAGAYEKLGKELKLIAGQVGGEAGKELDEVAEDLIAMGGGEKGAEGDGQDPAEPADPAAAQQDPTDRAQDQDGEGDKEGDGADPVPQEPAEAPPADPAPGTAVDDPDALTRAEVVDAFKSMVQVVEEMVGESAKATVEALHGAVAAAVKEAVDPLVARIDALERDDAQKIGEKAELTPAASLQDIIAAARKSAQTRIPEGHPLANLGGPPETDPGEKGKQQQAGGLFFQQFINGEDQAGQ